VIKKEGSGSGKAELPGSGKRKRGLPGSGKIHAKKDAVDCTYRIGFYYVSSDYSYQI